RRCAIQVAPRYARGERRFAPRDRSSWRAIRAWIPAPSGLLPSALAALQLRALCRPYRAPRTLQEAPPRSATEETRDPVPSRPPPHRQRRRAPLRSRAHFAAHAPLPQRPELSQMIRLIARAPGKLIHDARDSALLQREGHLVGIAHPEIDAIRVAQSVTRHAF